MNLHLTTSTTALPKQQRNPRRTVLGMVALALTVAAGIAAWQVTGPGAVTSSEPATVSTWESTAPSTPGFPTTTPILYLVRSQEDADLIQRIATEVGGQQTASSRLIAPDVLVTDHDAATLALVLQRSSGLTFVDLRAP